MFFLKDLPTDVSLQEFSRRFPNMNPSALKTCAELMRTGSDLMAVFETVLGKFGLSQGRLLVLIVMNRTPHEAVNPSFLAEKLGVTRATMTGLLNGLKTGDFIERVADPRDRRRIGVHLTPEGRQVLEKLLPDYYRNMARLTAGLSENERQTMLSLLVKINQKLNSLSAI
ncbi:MAG: MarR family transcriptional regulator [Deltaproteobacteria bacterium]|jgi:MarR family transcriptional regulator, negative regulator of the multidrug operon emrRAB|nr:MarR family transcriptional regulator [Deltaproteobacteria bacterium]